MAARMDATREALPALHQLGPTCRCKTCLALAEVEEWEQQMQGTNSLLDRETERADAAEARRDEWHQAFLQAALLHEAAEAERDKLKATASEVDGWLSGITEEDANWAVHSLRGARSIARRARAALAAPGNTA
jgi:uncharacterized coiled-coil DUF342 family protein